MNHQTVLQSFYNPTSEMNVIEPEIKETLRCGPFSALVCILNGCMYLTVLERLRQHLSVPLQDSCLVGELVKLRDVVRPDIRPGNRGCIRDRCLIPKSNHHVREIRYQVKADSPILKC